MRCFGCLFGVLLLAIAFVVALFVPFAWVSTPSSNAASITVTINASSTASDVADELVAKKVLSVPWGYEIYQWFDASANRAKAGDYVVQPGMSYRTLAREFAVGPEREEVSVTIPEGLDIQGEGALLEKQGVNPKDFLKLVGTPPDLEPFDSTLKTEYPFLADIPPGNTLEGYLYPDTYRVWKDQLPDGLVDKQLQTFADRTEGFEAQAKAEGHPFNDVIILASIIEKEVTSSTDRKIVAGIFWKRLAMGMPLQSDATINYVTGDGNARATADELKTVSPFNSYTNAGLPPSPICNPSLDSIEAALNPTKTDDLYFLTDDKGNVYYAKTLDEQDANKVKAYGK